MYRLSCGGNFAIALVCIHVSVFTVILMYRFFRFALISTALCVAGGFIMSLSAQEGGIITGKVTDGESGDLMRSVTVVLKDTKRGARTDVKGKYTIKSVPAGTYTVQFSFVGYKAKSVAGVQVNAGQTVTVNAVLQPENKKLDEVIVEARRSNDNQAAILAQRKNSAQVSDGVSQEEISKTPDGDAGQALKRVSGVTLVGDKFVYVRGVSDRYNNTTLNGSTLATTEPDKRSFAFDMFPSEFLQSANVAKSFTPDLPGNFVGGLVQLNTVDFPDGFGIKASVSTSFNTNTTLRDRAFLATPSGSSDWLGSDDGRRALPGSAPANRSEMDKLIRDSYAGNVAAQQRLQQFGRDLRSDNWKRDSLSASPNTSVGLSYSNIFNVLDNDLGVIASFSYGNSYTIKTASDRNTLLGNGSYERVSNGSVSNRSAGFGGLLNLAYKIGTSSSISIKNMFNRSMDDETLALQGADSTQGIDFRQFSAQFVQKTLYSTQVSGEHTLPWENMLLDWRLGYSESERSEPDFRRLRYSRQSSDPSAPFIADIQPQGDGTLAGRFFSNLSDKVRNAAFNLTIPLGPETKIKTGALVEGRDRSFGARSFTMGSNDANGLLGTAFYAGEPDKIFAAANFDPMGDTLYMREDSKPSDGYSGDETLTAAYAMIDAPFMLGDESFRVIAGARAEDNRIRLNGFYSNGQKADIDYHTFDILPALNLIYKVNSSTNIRTSASQTLTRPTFRELAPFEFYNFNDLIVVKGNPNLKRSAVQNFDIRYETFTGPGEVISVSGFYKRFSNPIEETLSGETGGKPERTWENGAHRDTTGKIIGDGRATNYGVELEVRKSLGFISSDLSNFLFSTNFALINSEITISQGRSSETRPMWGQSPYSLNMGLYYSNPDWGTSVNLAYNRAGRRIVSVVQLGRFAGLEGDGKTPHWYEEPRDLVDISISQAISSSLDAKFVVKDLLNQTLFWRQGDNVVQSNIFGTTFSLSLSYRIR
jgi:TonB-dependent receptor